MRPRLAALLQRCCDQPLRLRWSPLFRTAPVGGPPGQPAYLNAALLAGPLPGPGPDPRALLRGLQELERAFGRERAERWGPRTLDLDLLWCGEQRRDEPGLQLPHPRLRLRSFVLAPLAAIDPELVPPGPATGGEAAPAAGCAALLAALLPLLAEPPPTRLPPGPGWPE